MPVAPGRAQPPPSGISQAGPLPIGIGPGLVRYRPRRPRTATCAIGRPAAARLSDGDSARMNRVHMGRPEARRRPAVRRPASDGPRCHAPPATARGVTPRQRRPAVSRPASDGPRCHGPTGYACGGRASAVSAAAAPRAQPYACGGRASAVSAAAASPVRPAVDALRGAAPKTASTVLRRALPLSRIQSYRM